MVNGNIVVVKTNRLGTVQDVLERDLLLIERVIYESVCLRMECHGGDELMGLYFSFQLF